MTLEFFRDMIQEQLNGDKNSIAFKLKFKIHADIGDFQANFKEQDQDTINAVLIETTGDYTPVKEVSTKSTTLRLDLAVAQRHVDELKIILESWSKKQLGLAYKYIDDNGETTYIITPGAPVTGTAFNTCDIGSTLPISLTMEVQQTVLGLITNEMAWEISVGDIKNAAIEVLNFEIGSARTQQTANYINESATASSNQMVTKSITLRIAAAKTDICKKLFDDILTDNKDEIYNIKESDGWSNGIDDDFIMANGQLIGDTTKIVALQCTFLKSDEQME